MSEHEQEQEMELEALQAILMDDMVELESGQGGLGTASRCFQITITPTGDDEEDLADIPVRLALLFAHTPRYPDEPPLFDVRSLQGIKANDLKLLKEVVAREIAGNLGMAMIYTLVTTAKEWLREHYGTQGPDVDAVEEDQDSKKDEVIEPHGELVTVDTFLAWRERFEAEQALERAKLLPEAVLVAAREKRITGRIWFESGRAMASKGGKPFQDTVDDEDEDEIEIDDFEDDFGDEDLDEDDMLNHYLSGKTDVALNG